MRNKHYEVTISKDNTMPESALILMEILTVKHYTASVDAEFWPNYPTEDGLDEYCTKCLNKLKKDGFTWEVKKEKELPKLTF